MEKCAVVQRGEKRNFNRVIEVVSLTMIVAFITDTVLSLGDLPNNVPILFGLDGTFESFVSNKYAILVFSIIGVVALIGFNILAMYPNKLKYKVEITEENKEKQYELASTYMKILALEVVILSSYMQFNVTRATLASETSIGATYLIFLGIILVTTPIYQLISKRIK